MRQLFQINALDYMWITSGKSAILLFFFSSQHSLCTAKKIRDSRKIKTLTWQH